MAAFLSKYGEARTIQIPIIKRAVVDFAVSADWTPAAGDVKITKDGGAAANVTNLPTALTMGNTALWVFSLTATEMQAARIEVTVADAATKAVEDTAFAIETYGNASAQHAFDLDTASSAQTGDSFARLGAPAGASVSADVASVQTDTNDIQARLPAALVSGRMDSSVGAMAANVVTASSIAAAALNGKGDWNIGKTGYALSAAGVQAIWDALTSALTTAGSIGKLLVDNINATISSRSTVTTAQVNAEVVDALNVDTYAEPGQGAPAATTTLVGKIGYLYKAWRNKSTQDATDYKLFNDDAATVDQKATVSDDGTTFTRGEAASGP